ncbi:MAG: type II toxin-antitoxin system PemK/MazF family toxin [Candidatus Protochlamydia sp.]|nr:type II toxin-antitoxin system PemK/MazF family toxin [Candidatus Protochlamydia sp.]
MGKISSVVEVGDIVRVALDPTVGDEKQKERYCLVIEKGSSHLNLIIILPITNDTGKRNSQFYVPITNLNDAGMHKSSVIDCYQIRTISTNRLVKNKLGAFAVGKIGKAVLFEVRQRLSWLLDIGEEHVNAP